MLPKINSRKSKRLGRGYGSGKGGHTSSRGQKGQGSRGNIGILFEGVKVKKSLIKRLPLMRGKSKFKPTKKPVVVKIDYLNILPTGTKVTLDVLIKEKIVDLGEAKKYGVKILGGGKLEKKLLVSLPVSKSAATAIEKSGGKVEIQKN